MSKLYVISAVLLKRAQINSKFSINKGNKKLLQLNQKLSLKRVVRRGNPEQTF